MISAVRWTYWIIFIIHSNRWHTTKLYLGQNYSDYANTVPLILLEAGIFTLNVVQSFIHFYSVVNPSEKVGSCPPNGLDTSGDNKTSNSQSDLQIILSSLAQHKLDFACGPVIDFRARISIRNSSVEQWYFETVSRRVPFGRTGRRRRRLDCIDLMRRVVYARPPEDGRWPPPSRFLG